MNATAPLLYECTMWCTRVTGMLSRIVPLRRRMWRERQEAIARGERPTGQPVYPLKLIIMSATLRTADFTENKRLFATLPAVINVGRL